MGNNVENVVLQKSKRDARYELIRVLSIMLVLMVHVDCIYIVEDSFFAHGSLSREIVASIFICCNGLFFILSGKFALNFDENKSSYRDYYFKKLIYLLLPWFFYMGIETIAYAVRLPDCEFANSYWQNVTSKFSVRHYWFMFAIVFDLMFAPVFAKAFKSMSDRMVMVFFAIGVIHLTLFSYGPLLSGWFSYDSPFGQFHFHFFLGGILDRVIKIIGKKKLITIGLICFMLGRIHSVKLDYAQFTRDFSPFYLFTVIAAWIIICEIYNVIGQKYDKIIIFLGKYSFPVYLIHMVVLDSMVHLGWMKLIEIYPIYFVVTFVIVFSGSLLVAFIIDKLIMQHLQKGLNLAYSKLTGKSK